MHGEIDEEGWLTREQAAELLGKTPSTVDRWVRRGLLRRYRLSGYYPRFKKADVEALRTPRPDGQ